MPAATGLDSAADVPVASSAAICAAREVELTSIFSTLRKWVVRKFLHWPQACGCEYMRLMWEKSFSTLLSLSTEAEELEVGQGRPKRQCRTATYASSQTRISGCFLSRSAKRSRVKRTEPLELFSKGTTPRWAVPDCTAVKTSWIVVRGVRVVVGGSCGGKVERAA